jgi:hypothetical protein
VRPRVLRYHDRPISGIWTATRAAKATVIAGPWPVSQRVVGARGSVNPWPTAISTAVDQQSPRQRNGETQQRVDTVSDEQQHLWRGPEGEQQAGVRSQEAGQGDQSAV